MATRRTPRFKECRRYGVNVSGNPKALNRTVQSGKRQKKQTEYGLQLIEKQKLKSYYGILERQLRNYFAKAKKKAGMTGPNLIITLEKRLDNLVYRIGFANSIRQARQMVSHGHVLVDGKRIDIPSYEVPVGSQISLKEASRKNEIFSDNFVNGRGFPVPYLDRDFDHFSAILTREPLREEVPIEVQDHMIVEFYSR